MSRQINGDGFRITAPGNEAGPRELWTLISSQGGRDGVMGPFRDVSAALARAGLLASGRDGDVCQVVRYLRDDSDEPYREIERSWAPRPFMAVRRVGDKGDGDVGLLLTDGHGWLIRWSHDDRLDGPIGIADLYRQIRPAVLVRGGGYEQEQPAPEKASTG